LKILRAAAASEGFGFIDRLIDDWQTGLNRFDRPGERFFGSFQEDRLLAVCGLNRDPYVDQDGVGRLRHLYVLRAVRRRGVATALVKRALSEAAGFFRFVRLQTDNQEAAELYAKLGFAHVIDETASHVIALP
jgi:GNAT superfamily N-acetyltransferase